MQLFYYCIPLSYFSILCNSTPNLLPLRNRSLNQRDASSWNSIMKGKTLGQSVHFMGCPIFCGCIVPSVKVWEHDIISIKHVTLREHLPCYWTGQLCSKIDDKKHSVAFCACVESRSTTFLSLNVFPHSLSASMQNNSPLCVLNLPNACGSDTLQMGCVGEDPEAEGLGARLPSRSQHWEHTIQLILPLTQCLE